MVPSPGDRLQEGEDVGIYPHILFSPMAWTTPRVWFVTGASTGFGRIMTEYLLKKGERVVATLRKPQVIADLESKYPHSQLLVLKLDVVDKNEIVEAFKEAIVKFERIDVVFNNAGACVVSEVEATHDETARALFEVNFWGATAVAREAIKYFREVNKPPGGQLLHVSSIFGIESSPVFGYYSATKYAGDALIESLARELDPAWNITVSILCPGMFNTGLVTHHAVTEPSKEVYSKDTTLPSQQLRHLISSIKSGDTPYIGDSEKLIEAIYEVSKGDELPVRIPLGADAVAGFELKSAALLKGVEEGKKWSESLSLRKNESCDPPE